TIEAVRNLWFDVSSEIHVDGGQGGDGGTVTLFADGGNATIDGIITADGSGAGAFGGEIAIEAGTNGTIQITRTIEATTTTNGLFDGVISLGPACNVVISGTLHTRTPQVPDGLGTAFIEYHGSLNLANGRLLSDTGGNQIFCKCVDNNGDRVCD